MKFQTPKGTRDLFPEDAEKLQKIIDTIIPAVEKYGFRQLVTPSFESFELLSKKSGEAIKNEIYYFKDKSDRELGLRFELTASFARIVASTPNLSKPFKRVEVGKVWRYDNPQAMRWREFWQADIDIAGSASPLADVECLAAVCECMENLGFKDFFIRLNNRKLLQNVFKSFVEENKVADVFRTIDKMDKIGEEGVRKELEAKEVVPKKILEFINISGNNQEKIERLKEFKCEGLDEIMQALDYAKSFGIEKRIKIDLSLVRGLEYYTGLVYEVFLGTDVSCGGGGRYDKLVESLGGIPTPMTGISLGLERILEVMKTKKMFKEDNKIKIFIANVNEGVRSSAIKIAQELRAGGIKCQIDLMNRSLGKQLEYADNMQIPFVLIVGEKEVKKKMFKLKDMKKKTEKEMSLEKIMKLIA
jgi:histidyl-tRNA synthetase